MKSRVDGSCATTAILEDARAMQMIHGGRMIRNAGRMVSRAVAYLWHVRHAAVGHHSTVS